MGEPLRRAFAFALVLAGALLIPHQAAARAARLGTRASSLRAHPRLQPAARPEGRSFHQAPQIASDVAPSLPRPEVLALALRAFRCAASRGEVTKPTLALIDYTLPSTEKRLWILDTETGRVLAQELVAHGRESGDVVAERFSNATESYQSSVGFFVGRDRYYGSHGLSLRLAGLEPGFNDHAEARSIVMHGAWYVSAEHIARFGRLGRSLGCPALAPEVASSVIDRLRGGAALFAYANDPDWLERSPYLSCDPATLPTRVASTTAVSATR
jgi:hypothetical protein